MLPNSFQSLLPVNLIPSPLTLFLFSVPTLCEDVLPQLFLSFYKLPVFKLFPNPSSENSSRPAQVHSSYCVVRDDSVASARQTYMSLSWEITVLLQHISVQFIQQPLSLFFLFRPPAVERRADSSSFLKLSRLQVETLSTSLTLDWERLFLANRSLLVLLSLKLLIWIQLRKRTGALKNSTIRIERHITTQRNQAISHPTHSSYRGHTSVSPLHSSARVTMLEIMMVTKHKDREMRKTRKLAWLLTPTQLFNQGQW